MQSYIQGGLHSAPDLAGGGFPLAGGRIDIVGNAPVPTMVYRHDRHVISVTVTASTPDVIDGEEAREGSAIECWTTGGLTYLAVSDLNPLISVGSSRCSRQRRYSVSPGGKNAEATE